MNDEIEQPLEFETYPCSLGTVIGYEGSAYRIATPEGRVVGIAANGTPSPEAVEADIANPPAPVVLRRQSSRIVLARMTTAERNALRACPVPEIQDAYDIALIEGAISEADTDFPAFRTALDQLGIISASRWNDLLAP
jgi:hypothetical protein